jgi:CheY-like chemotaxis protein
MHLNHDAPPLRAKTVDLSATSFISSRTSARSPQSEPGQEMSDDPACGTVVSGLLSPSATLKDEHLNRARVLLADDHKDFLAAAARLLQPEFEVVKTVGNGQSLLEEAARLEPDVLVVDISMPVLNGLEAARQLRAAGSRAKIVFLSAHRDPDYVRAALAAGAQGYVIKCQLATDLLLALREALADRSFVSPSITLEHEED